MARDRGETPVGHRDGDTGTAPEAAAEECRMDAARPLTDQASQQAGMSVGTADLAERDRQILDFERQWWKYAGAKETAIRELFDMSSTRYYQLLNALLDSPAALEHDPMLVKRLRRMRASRQRARSARRLVVDV
jgi:hypothetical protein